MKEEAVVRTRWRTRLKQNKASSIIYIYIYIYNANIITKIINNKMLIISIFIWAFALNIYI